MKTFQKIDYTNIQKKAALLMQDIDEIMNEVDVDAIACYTVMEYLANEKQWKTMKHILAKTH